MKYIRPCSQCNNLLSNIKLKYGGLQFCKGTINLKLFCIKQWSLCGGKNPPVPSFKMCVLCMCSFQGSNISLHFSYTGVGVAKSLSVYSVLFSLLYSPRLSRSGIPLTPPSKLVTLRPYLLMVCVDYTAHIQSFLLSRQQSWVHPLLNPMNKMSHMWLGFGSPYYYLLIYGFK